MRLTTAADPDSPVLLLAHGAGAGSEHPWIQRVAGGLAGRGISVVTFDFPYRQEKRRLPDRGPVLESAFQAAWNSAIALTQHDRARPSGYFAGGKSMGGRIASQVAAKDGFDPPATGLVFFGYPLHPPAKPEQRRDRHLPNITVPMLFHHGTRDPFGTPEELEALVSGLRRAYLHIVMHGDHSLVAPKKADHPGSSFELVLDLTARWMQSTIRGAALDASSLPPHGHMIKE